MGTLRRAATIRDWYWSARMQAHAIEPGAVALIEPGRKLHIKELDIDLTPHSHEFFLKGLKAAKLLANEGGARFSVDADSRIRIEIDGIRAFVESYQDLLILNEIFLAGVYNVTTPAPVIVIDIGMNVGYTSLFFARQPHVVAVHGFEPFEPTFQQLQRNLDLNPSLRGRIRAYNVGLGSADTVVKLPYSYQKKGSMGVAPLKRGPRLTGELTEIPITIANAARLQEFTGPLDASHDLLLKVDCEGAEYEILPALHASGVLARTTAVALEWHDRGPDLLSSVLRSAGFAVLAMPDPLQPRFGMMYAVRTALRDHTTS